MISFRDRAGNRAASRLSQDSLNRRLENGGDIDRLLGLSKEKSLHPATAAAAGNVVKIAPNIGSFGNAVQETKLPSKQRQMQRASERRS